MGSERGSAWQYTMMVLRATQERLVRHSPRLLLDGLMFAEGPRWNNGRLIFSDMHAGEVVAVSLDGTRETLVTLPPATRKRASTSTETGKPAMPSGLGTLPDGSLLIVSMEERVLLRLDAAGKLAKYADLSSIATHHCNDMLVDGLGRAYVGNFGWDIFDPQVEQKTASLALVELPRGASLLSPRPAAAVRAVADGLSFPNGMALTPDGKTLIVAETFGQCLSAFDVAEDGGLSNRRLWARLLFPPDGALRRSRISHARTCAAACGWIRAWGS
jgi:sugar lactone lactonase YvrE